MMGQVFTRQEWNNLVQSVNSLAGSPPNGCNSAPTLSEVPEKHRWSVAGVQAMRDTLRAICGDNTFSADLTKWNQAILTELYAAVSRGWCGCAETPCNDDVDHDPGIGISDVHVDGHINYLRLTYGWNDTNHNGVPDEGDEYPEICSSDERNIQTGTIHPYPALNGFQVYADFYVANIWENQHLSGVRTWDLRRVYWPYTDSGVCPSLPIKVNFYNTVLMLAGELQPNGSILLFGDPEIGSGICGIADETYSNYVPWGAYSLHGHCFKFGLDNYTIASGLPGNTKIGNIITTDSAYLINLVGLGAPGYTYTNDVMQVGVSGGGAVGELRTRRTFYPGEWITFTLRASGNSALRPYGPYDRTFQLRIT